jgi:hypothetical protein
MTERGDFSEDAISYPIHIRQPDLKPLSPQRLMCFPKEPDANSEAYSGQLEVYHQLHCLVSSLIRFYLRGPRTDVCYLEPHPPIHVAGLVLSAPRNRAHVRRHAIFRHRSSYAHRPLHRGLEAGHHVHRGHHAVHHSAESQGAAGPDGRFQPG